MQCEQVGPNLSIPITTLSSVYKPESVTPRRLNIADACKLFTKHVQAPRKESVAMYSAAIYGLTLYREEVNVEAMSAGIVDFDNEAYDTNGKKLGRCSDRPTRPEDQYDNLNGLTYFYHSTFSNTASWPKWRLIIPFERQATLQEWPFVVNGIISILGGQDPNIDHTCFELSRAFYVPSYPQEHASAAFSGYSDGKEVVSVFP